MFYLYVVYVPDKKVEVNLSYRPHQNDRLHMFTNMQLGTAKSEGLFFLFTGALCNAVRHLLAFSSLTGQYFTGRRDFT